MLGQQRKRDVRKAALNAAFHILAGSKDGRVSRSQWAQLYSRLHDKKRSPYEADRSADLYFERIDADGSGYLDLKECANSRL